MRTRNWMCMAATGLTMMGLSLADAKPEQAADAAHDKAAVTAKAGAPAEADKLKPQTMCPIMTNMKINKNQYVDHEGQRIYVCCGGCRRAVADDFEAAVAKLAEMGQRPHPIKEKAGREAKPAK